MNKFKGYLICSDCDGTLTDGKGALSEENAAAIRYFQEEGGLFTLATGRFPDHIKQFEQQFQINAPIVSMNGTALYDTEKDVLIQKWPMQTADCEELLHYIYAHWPQVGEYWLNYTCHDSVGYKRAEHPSGDGSLDNYLAALPEEIYKMVIVQPEDVTPLVQKDLKEKFGDRFRFDTSWPNGLEIQRVDSGKGVAVRYMKDYLENGIHTTVGIGDYENDISLLECADIGVAVANALEHVKAMADVVTVSNDESAIAAVVAYLEEQMGKSEP